MTPLLAAVLNEETGGNFSLELHLGGDHPTQQAGEVAMTERLETLLRFLMQQRAGMQPPVSTVRPQPGQVTEAIFGSGWQIDPTLAGDVAMRFHHPALGWMTWHMPHQTAREMGTALLRLLDEQKSPPGSVQ